MKITRDQITRIKRGCRRVLRVGRLDVEPECGLRCTTDRGALSFNVRTHGHDDTDVADFERITRLVGVDVVPSPADGVVVLEVYLYTRYELRTIVDATIYPDGRITVHEPTPFDNAAILSV